MKREIKYNAWNEARNEMWDCNDLILARCYLAPSGVGFVRLTGDGGTEQMKFLKPLQFTGLSCHGKEVYEGDLLERSASFGRGKVIGEVYFDVGQFRIRWTPEEKGRNNSLYLHLNDCEHKGNIYENPELL